MLSRRRPAARCSRCRSSEPGGTTLDLAATLLTVSVVSVESESGGGAGAASGAAPGAGQGSLQGSAQGRERRLGRVGRGTEPGGRDQRPGESAAASERPPVWERLSIGLERAWEKARAMILEAEGPVPAAENRQATVPPATGRKHVPPAQTPTQPTTKDRTGAQAKPTVSSEAAIVAPGLPMGASFMHKPKDTSPVVDAALGDLAADRLADGTSARSGMELWDELAQAQSPERTRALVAIVASAAVASAGWTLGEKVIRRRSVASNLPAGRWRDAFEASRPLWRMTSVGRW